MRFIFQLVALVLMLVALPAVSWIYLSNGYNYQKKVMAELKNLGKMGDLPSLTLSGDTLARASWKGKIVVAGPLDLLAAPAKSPLLSHLQELHQQFDDRKDVLFVLYPTTQDTAAVWAYARTNGLWEKNQTIFLGDVAAGKSRHHWSGDSAEFTLTDSKGQVRKAYDLRQGAQYARLVEHIALLLPIERKERPVLQREAEK